MIEKTRDKNWQRKQNRRNAQRVANAIYGMLMARAILRNPLLVAASAQHAPMISRPEKEAPGQEQELRGRKTETKETGELP